MNFFKEQTAKGRIVNAQKEGSYSCRITISRVEEDEKKYIIDEFLFDSNPQLSGQTKQLTILHTNDAHSQIYPLMCNPRRQL